MVYIRRYCGNSELASETVNQHAGGDKCRCLCVLKRRKLWAKPQWTNRRAHEAKVYSFVSVHVEKCCVRETRVIECIINNRQSGPSVITCMHSNLNMHLQQGYLISYGSIIILLKSTSEFIDLVWLPFDLVPHTSHTVDGHIKSRWMLRSFFLPRSKKKNAFFLAHERCRLRARLWSRPQQISAVRHAVSMECNIQVRLSHSKMCIIRMMHDGRNIFISFQTRTVELFWSKRRRQEDEYHGKHLSSFWRGPNRSYVRGTLLSGTKELVPHAGQLSSKRTQK